MFGPELTLFKLHHRRWYVVQDRGRAWRSHLGENILKRAYFQGNRITSRGVAFGSSIQSGKEITYDS